MAAAGLLLCPAPGGAGSAPPDLRRDATVNAIEQVMPSVVNIATETAIEFHDWYDELLRQFYGVRPPQQISLGSGVIIDEEGYILTNFHVIRRATRIQIKLWDGREYEADPIVATTGSDVALIKIRAKPGDKFKAIKFAADDDLLLGETVIALGNPFGLGGSVTKGILSSKNRRPSTGNEPLNVEDWLQTDAAINPGNSGGPLVNLRAELIGINVAVYREERGQRGVGVGFSIPVKQVSAALSRFFTPEVTEALWFGAEFKMGTGPLVVGTVYPGSPAERAGLRANDRIMEIAGQAPEGLIHGSRLLSEATQPVQLVVGRGNERRRLQIKLLPFEEVIRQKLGMSVLVLNAQTAGRAGYRAGEGLLIEEVEKGGPADRAKLQRGYLMATIEGQNAADVRNVMQVLSRAQSGDSVRLTVVVPRRLGGSYLEYRQGSVDVKVR